MKKEELNYIAFYGLSYKDELYYITKTNRKKFEKYFGFDIFMSEGGNDDAYDWVKENCRFVGYCVCTL